MSATALKTAVTGQEPPPKDREQTPYERFRDYVQKPAFANDLVRLLGSEQRAQTFVRVVLTAVQQTPALLDADRRTLLLACMKAARDKLMPDGKEAVFNIYRTKEGKDERGQDRWINAVQYLPMVGGLVKKLYDSGLVIYVDAAAVYEKDEFTFVRGDVTKLEHRPTLKDDPGPVVAAYAVFKLNNGEVKREVMPRRDIEKVRASSKAPDGLMWKTFYDQGAIKSVIKRAYKQLPSAPELDQVVAHDNEAMGVGIDINEASFSGATASPPIEGEATTVPEQKPAALEDNPAQTIPGVVGTNPAEGLELPKAAAKPEKAPKASKPAPPAAATEPAKPKPKDGDPVVTFAEVSDKLERADNRDDFDAAVDLIRHVQNEQHRRELAAQAADILSSSAIKWRT